MPTPRRTAACLAASVLLVTGCAAFDPHNVLSRHAPATPAGADTPVPAVASPSLGLAARKTALDFVWNTINERYYDPNLNGVDWRAARERWAPLALAAASDEEYWDHLDRMAGELRDAHTRVESPKRAELIARDESVSLGIAFLPLEGRLVVTGVRADSDAYWAGVRTGMTLAEVGGQPAQAAYAAALDDARQSSTAQARHRAAARRLLEGEAETTATLAFVRGDGSRFAATLKRKRFASPPSVMHRVLPSGYGYIRLGSWDQFLQGRMVGAIEALKDTPGLVIDLRGNPGGSAFMVNRVAEQFFAGTVAAGRSITRTGKPVTLAFGAIELVKLQREIKGNGTYRGPVVVLVNEASASGSELFAGLLQALGRATIVGRTSCGCMLAYLGYADVPGGGKLAYSEVAFEFTNGKRIEREGVAPDVPVAITVADLLVGRDRTLEVAQERLKGMQPTKGPVAAGGKEKP
jgi:carboxyl-terminal processing protease